jgi:ribosome-associated protein
VVRKLESYLADKARIQQDDSDLTSRTDLRRERLKNESHYMKLSERLCSTSVKRLAHLELSEHLLELIDAARRIESPAARDRALRRVRKELRDIDTTLLERKLDDLDNPGPGGPQSPEQLWTQRITTTGESGIEAFLETCPQADRGHLRTLLRNVTRAKDTERAKVTKKLTLALKDCLSTAQSAADVQEELEESST